MLGLSLLQAHKDVVNAAKLQGQKKLELQLKHKSMKEEIEVVRLFMYL